MQLNVERWQIRVDWSLAIELMTETLVEFELAYQLDDLTAHRLELCRGLDGLAVHLTYTSKMKRIIENAIQFGIIKPFA